MLFWYACWLQSKRFHSNTVWKQNQHEVNKINDLATHPRGPQNTVGQWVVSSSIPYSQPKLHLYSNDSFSRTRPTVVPTHRAVRSHPVGVTAAQPSVWYEGPVTMALVWALGPGQLAMEPSPTWLTVALPIHTDAIVGTRWIQAIHCIKPEVHQCEMWKKYREKLNEKKEHKSRKCHIRAEVRNKWNIMRHDTGHIFILCVHRKIMK